jgi:hypothetical protein
MKKTDIGFVINKKVCIVLVLLLLLGSMVVALEPVNSSEGIYYCSIQYIGYNQGREWVSSRLNLGNYYTVKLSRGQLECVNNLINRYETTTGDTFCVTISPFPEQNIFISIEVFCEFTSNTQYTYWVLKCRPQRNLYN